MASSELTVEVYSGYTYAERPRAFTVGDRRYDIEVIERAWRAPEGPAFVVRTRAGDRWELAYDEVQDVWHGCQINIKGDEG